MKLCNTCGNIKSPEEFHKRSASKDGLAAKCKPCQKEYDFNRKNKAERVDKNKARLAKMKTDDPEKYDKQVNGAKRKYRDKNPLKYKAHCAVNNALRDNKITKPSSCECCGEEKKLEAHHDSYQEQHWLDVRWVCDPCHKAIHVQLRKENRCPDA
ncbi:baseplate wedge protein [Pseudoalteromonas phage J2-1_QLiu-2017]|nr:baseplate wedge protein [Pseudoalteromonas phage J2-1_QLiu-2017]